MSLVLRKVAALNRSGALAVPVRYSEVKSILEAAGEERALELLKQLESDGHSVANPVQYLKDLLEGGRAPDDDDDSAKKRKAVDADGPIAKRVRAMNASGELVGSIDFERVRTPLASLSVPKAMTILKGLEDVGADVLDPTSYVRAAVRGAGGVVPDDDDEPEEQAEEEDNADEEEPAPKRAKKLLAAKQENTFAYAKPEGTGGTDIERIERRIHWLNRNGSLERPVDVEAALPALDSIGVGQAMRVLRRLEENALTVQDPDGYIQDNVARSGWIWAADKTLVDEDTRVARRVSWLNQFGGLSKPIDYSEVADSLDGLKVAHAMVLLRELEVESGKIPDPTEYIKRTISLAGEDDVQIPAVDVGPNTTIGRRVMQLNSYAGLNKPIDYNAVGEDLARIGDDAALQLLQEVEDKGTGVKDPTGYLRFKLRAKLASLGTLEDVAAASDETKILKRIEWLNDYGSLEQDINYPRVGKSLESVGIDHAMTILKELEDKGNSVPDPDAFILFAIASSRKRAAHKKPVAAPPAKRAATAAGGGGADLQTLFGVVGVLNKSGRAKKQIKFADIAPALDSLGSDRALRILQEMQQKGLGLDDPVQYIKAAAQRTLASRVKAVKAEKGEDEDDVAKITSRLNWLNQFGNLVKPIKVPEVVGALYCLGVPATMTILRGLQEKGPKVPDPTYHIKAAVQRANGVRVALRPVKKETEIGEDEEEVEEEEATTWAHPKPKGLPVPWEAGQEEEEDEDDAARALADGYEDFAGEDGGEEAYYAAHKAEEEAVADDGDDGNDGVEPEEDADEALSAKKKTDASLLAVKEESGVRRVVGGLTGFHKLTPSRRVATAEEKQPAAMPMPTPIKAAPSLPVTPQEKMLQVRNVAIKCGLQLDELCLKSLARLPFYKVKDMIDDVLLGGKDRKGVKNPSRYLTIGCQKQAGGLGVEQGIAMELAVSLGVVLNNEALDELASIPRKEAHEIIKEVSKSTDAREDPIGFIKMEVTKCRANIEARPFPIPTR